MVTLYFEYRLMLGNIGLEIGFWNILRGMSALQKELY